MDQVMYDVKPKHKLKLDYVFHLLLICFALNMVVLYWPKLKFLLQYIYMYHIFYS